VDFHVKKSMELFNFRAEKKPISSTLLNQAHPSLIGGLLEIIATNSKWMLKEKMVVTFLYK